MSWIDQPANVTNGVVLAIIFLEFPAAVFFFVMGRLFEETFGRRNT